MPDKPDFLPLVGNQESALRLIRTMAPEADEYELIQNDGIEFFDCGGNFETIKCPNCQSVVDVEWWGKKMSEDYVSSIETKEVKSNKIPRFFQQRLWREKQGFPTETQGFQLLEYKMPCCSFTLSLDRLLYDWPQVFGRFGLSVMNPNIGLLSDEQVTKLQEELGCSVIAVYQRI